MTFRRKFDLNDEFAGGRKRVSCLLYKSQLTLKLCYSKTYQQGFPRWFRAVLVSPSKAFRIFRRKRAGYDR